MSKVVHCKKAAKGSFHYIGRPSPLGNPFPLDDPADDDARRNVIEQYAEWFAGRVEDPTFRAEVEKVRGKDLGCWCAPRPCHGDVILSWLARNPPRETGRADG